MASKKRNTAKKSITKKAKKRVAPAKVSRGKKSQALRKKPIPKKAHAVRLKKPAPKKPTAKRVPAKRAPAKPKKRPQKVASSAPKKRPQKVAFSTKKKPHPAKRKPLKRRSSPHKQSKLPAQTRRTAGAGQKQLERFVKEARKTRALRQKLAETQRELEATKAREFEALERAAIQADAAPGQTLDPQVAGGKNPEDRILYDALRWLREDASPAMQPTILRHMTEAWEWRRQLQMVGHGEPNSKAFLAQAKKIAREAGVSVREVYTLWWSP
jgi:hypothetical protein